MHKRHHNLALLNRKNPSRTFSVGILYLRCCDFFTIRLEIIEVKLID